MLRFIVLCLVIAVVSCYTPAIKYPKKYAGHVSKVSVMSGLVEEIDLWVTPTKSRIDYNNGAVKSIVHGQNRRLGIKYEIHPETLEGAKPTMACNMMSQRDGPQTIFPDLKGFINKGEEMMRDKKCIRLEKDEVSKQWLLVKRVLWVYFEHRVHAYLPVRLERNVYNTLLGQHRRHDFIEFLEFHDDFDEEKVFNTQLWCGLKNTIVHKIHNESVTKHLMFIDPENKKHVNHIFKTFKKHYNQSYANRHEHELRKHVFQENMRLIRSTNLNNLGYKLAVNKFTDRLPEEMIKYTGRLPRAEGDVGTHPFPYDELTLQDMHTKLPKVFDLRDEGFVSAVENQEQCGSCWTFGTTGAVEGALARKLGQEKKLAKQALLDCTWEFGAAGCDGGTDTAAYKMMMEYGMPMEAEYGTYEAHDDYCKIKNMTKTYKIRGFVDVLPNSISALKVALYEHGPLSVSVHVTDAWSSYSSGIFYDFTCSNNPRYLNHEVTLVGYGEYLDEPYWVIKNSWGQDWGQAGYMQIVAKDNHCGVMSEPTYVLF